jgi:hypothetical protein
MKFVCAHKVNEFGEYQFYLKQEKLEIVNLVTENYVILL